MDIRPRNASPILNRKTKPKIPIAIETPFFLKKLTIGPPIVPLNQENESVPNLLFTFTKKHPKITKKISKYPIFPSIMHITCQLLKVAWFAQTIKKFMN